VSRTGDGLLGDAPQLAARAALAATAESPAAPFRVEIR
jgi:hypothetical protein